tara:strand:- start:1243 stop:2025 length:783 start_codon:yes stop_codon:yes gene_type:complete
MTNYLEKIHSQEKINTAIGVANVVQTAAMNAKLRRLNEAQEESNQIQRQIAQINLYMAEQQKQLVQTSKKSLEEQEKQTKILEIQTTLTQFKIDLDIEEKKQERADKEKISHMMEIVFQTTEDLEEIPSSGNHNIEKFFQIQALIKNCIDAGVATTITDDIKHKQYIKECLNNMNIQKDIVLGKLTEEEKRDLQVLIDILSVDEKKLIHDEQKKIKKINKQLGPVKRKKTLLKKKILQNQEKISELELHLKTLKQTNPKR